MINQITQFKSVIQNFENTFHFAQNCPIGVAKEAIFNALKWIGQIEDQVKAAAEAAKEQTEKAQEALQPTEEKQAQEPVQE